jgi:hypothetical protein
LYARHEVEYAWIVDTSLRMVEAFRLMDGRWVLIAVHGGDDPARIEPFEAVELPVARLWVSEAAPA